MVGISMGKGLQQKFFSLDFIGPPFSKALMNMFKDVTVAKELVAFP